MPDSADMPQQAALMAFVPEASDPVLAHACIDAAVQVAQIACVVLPSDRKTIETVLPAVQARDIAVLIADDTRSAAYAGADGVHVTGGIEDLRAARKSLGRRASIGALSPCSRHTAMLLGEAEADYIAFDVAAPGGLDMVDWWAELFQLPCVALGALDMETAAIAIRTGADFVSPPPEFWTSPEAATRIARDLLEAAQS